MLVALLGFFALTENQSRRFGVARNPEKFLGNRPVLFEKWNSFSRVAVYDRAHGDWSLSPNFTGDRGSSLFMDIDSAASTPILATRVPEDASYLRYELTALAYHLGAGFVPVRKPKKLPAECVSVSYDLEYGQDALEIHADAVDRDQRVLIVDDVLATGGTAAAAAQLVRKAGGNVLGLAFLIELVALKGKAKLPGESVFSVLQY